MISDRERAFAGITSGIRRVAEQMGESLTLHPSTVYVFRRGTFVGSEYEMPVELDERPLPPLAATGCVCKTTPAGKHTLKVLGKTLELNVEENKSYYVNAEFPKLFSKEGVQLKLLPEAEGAAAIKKMKTPMRPEATGRK